MSSVVRMQVLGGFSIECDGAPVPIPSARLQVLLAFLALQRGKPQRRQALAFLLWPDSSEAQAQTNLRTLLSRLQSVQRHWDPLLLIDAKSVAWHPAITIELDVASFEEALRPADAGAKAANGDATRSALEQAVATYAGDLLPGCSDEWVVAERERLRQLLFGALEQLIALLEQRREYAAAIGHARRLVHLDRVNEAAYLTLMRLYSLTGNRTSALRVYHTGVSTLRGELAEGPGAALTTAYELLLASETPRLAAEGATPPPRLFGRVREWQRLLATWQIAAAGQPRLLVLSGEAGIGKARLAKELLDWGNRQGILTAAAECYAAEGEVAFAPVITWLRSHALRPSLERLGPEWLSELARLAPDVVPRRLVTRELGALTEQWQRLFEALARAVLPTGQPIMLLIDDLQWCSRDTLGWLHFLLRFDARARLLVVGTVRPEEVASDHPLAELLHALRREGRLIEVTVGPLNQEEAAALAGLVVNHPLDQGEAANLYTETEGNPLFIVETARAQLAASASGKEQPIGDTSPESASLGGGDLPPGVRAVIARRLGQVTPTAQALLSAAAVIGRSFPAALLERVARVDEDAFLQALDEDWQRRLVREHGPDAYDFTHDKLRAVAYAGLGTARRRVLHRRVAEALEAEHAADLDAVAAQLALHYERAGLPGQAVFFYGRAASAARRLYANATAIAQYQRALALVSGQAEAAALRDAIGEVQHRLGKYDEAQAEWQAALDLLPTADRVGRAHLQRKLGNVSRDQYRYAEALAAYDLAETTLGDDGNTASAAWWLAWAHLQLERVQTLYWLGQASEIIALVGQIRAAFEAHLPASLWYRLYQATALALLRRDRYVVAPETREMFAAYLRAVEAANDVDAMPAARFQSGFMLLWAGDLDGAEREIDLALTIAQRAGDISLEGRCLTYLTVAARKRQQVDRARQLGEQSLRVATAGHMPDYVGAAHGNLAWVAWRRADYATAVAHAQEALPAWGRLSGRYMAEWLGRWPLIGVALERGAIATAVEHARVLLDERQQRPPETLERALSTAIEAADQGNVAAARMQLAAAADAARGSGGL